MHWISRLQSRRSRGRSSWKSFGPSSLRSDLSSRVLNRTQPTVWPFQITFILILPLTCSPNRCGSSHLRLCGWWILICEQKTKKLDYEVGVVCTLYFTPLLLHSYSTPTPLLLHSYSTPTPLLLHSPTNANINPRNNARGTNITNRNMRLNPLRLLNTRGKNHPLPRQNPITFIPPPRRDRQRIK